MHVLDPEKTGTIKRLLRHHPRGMTISDLSSATKMNRNLMAKYLDVLHYSGHVEMQVTGTAKVYFISHRIPVSAMLEFSSDYIVVLDANLKILQVNARLLALHGMDRDQMIGRRIDEIDHPFLNKNLIRELPETSDLFEDRTVEISALMRDRRLYFSMKQVPMVFEDGSSGMTLILEDITARKEAEEKIHNHILRQEFFSRKLQEFAELPPGADIYAAIGAGFFELLPDAIIDVNAFDLQTRTLGIRAIFGRRSGEYFSRLAENHVCWEACPAYDTVPEVLRAGTLFTLPGGTRYASFNQVSEESAQAIDDEFDIGPYYSIGLNWRDTLLGNVLFVLRKGDTIHNAPFIETFGRVASIALQRHIAEEAYIRTRETSIVQQGQNPAIFPERP